MEHITPDENRILANKLFGQLQNGFSHPRLKKWRKNYRVFSKAKSKNFNVLHLYDYLLQHDDEDGDFWCFGKGNWELQKRLNDFSKENWNELKYEIFNWDPDHRDQILESIPFGSFDLFHSRLKEHAIPFAVDFLIDMFILVGDVDARHDLAHPSMFINRGNSSHIEKLKFIRDWMIENGFNNEAWLQSEINPIKYIEEAIEKAANRDI